MIKRVNKGFCFRKKRIFSTKNHLIYSKTTEKRQSVESMIDKARLAATKKQSRSTDVETCPSNASPPTGT
jgi:hypothetical protein